MNSQSRRMKWLTMVMVVTVLGVLVKSTSPVQAREVSSTPTVDSRQHAMLFVPAVVAAARAALVGLAATAAVAGVVEAVKSVAKEASARLPADRPQLAAAFDE